MLIDLHLQITNYFGLQLLISMPKDLQLPFTNYFGGWFSTQVNESKDKDRVIYIYNQVSLYTNITG